MHAALARNFALLQPLSAAALVNSASGSGAGAQAPLPGLLAVHIRRGDYERHCARLAAWGSLYMGFNEFPGLPDTFDPRPYASPSAAPNASRAAAADADADAPPQGETRLRYYMRHCLPSAAQVAARLHAVRAAAVDDTNVVGCHHDAGRARLQCALGDTDDHRLAAEIGQGLVGQPRRCHAGRNNDSE